MSNKTEIPDQKPTVGRTVHYYEAGNHPHETTIVPRCAFVTQTNREMPELGEGFVALTIMRPAGMSHLQRVPYSKTKKTGCWGWPERV